MKDKIALFLMYTFMILLILFILFAFGFWIYLWVTYGNLPPDEVPSWVHWLMWRR